MDTWKDRGLGNILLASRRTVFPQSPGIRLSKQIDYYFSISSPWSYFGHQRFLAIATKYGAKILPRVVDLAKVFPVSGGLPLPKRAPQRQAYRMFELKRWQKHLGLTLNPTPKFFPVCADPSALITIAALEKHGADTALRLAGALMRAAWVEEKDLAAVATLKATIAAQGLDADALYARSLEPAIQAIYERDTQDAIDKQVFGAPWYVYNGEPYWGQDRLDFVERALAA